MSASDIALVVAICFEAATIAICIGFFAHEWLSGLARNASTNRFLNRARMTSK